jgi:hypothetical protein
MKSRSITVLWVVGISLVILPVCMLFPPWLLAKRGIIDMWTGIAVSGLGLLLLPWLAGIGVSLVLTAIVLRQKSRQASRHSRIVLAAVVSVLFLLNCVLMVHIRRIVMNAAMSPPLELWHARVILGAGRFSREVAYRLPDIGVVTDIQQDNKNRLTIAGRRGAAFVHADGTPIETIPFEACKSDIVSVNTARNEEPYFLCRGGWIEDPKLFDREGRFIWSFGISRDGVDDSAVGDFGDGPAVAVGFNAGGGVRLVDPMSSGGRELWSQQDDGNIWHIEIASSEKYPEGVIVHSNAGGELVVRGKNGVVLTRQKPAIYLAKFSLSDWGGDPHLDKLIASDESGIYVLRIDGRILAHFPIDHEEDVTDIKASSLRASDGNSYFAVVQDYGAWHRSRIRIYDQQNLPVYEEVVGDDCAALRAIPNHTNSQTLLMGCNGTVFSYLIRRDSN